MSSLIAHLPSHAEDATAMAMAMLFLLHLVGYDVHDYHTYTQAKSYVGCC